MSWSNIIEQEINSVSPYGFNFAGYSKDTEFYAMRNDRQFLYAYQSCPPLRAIITARSKAFNRGKLKVVNKDKEEVKGKEANNLLSLLAKPNSIQSTNQFFTQLHQYIDIFGYAVVLKVKSTGFNNVTSLWNIPNWLIQINYNDRFVIAGDLTDAIKSIDFIYGGGQNVSLDDVMFIFDEGIGSDFNYKQNIYIPDSRIKTLEYPINNIIAAYKARNTLITSKGALGILSSNVQADSMKTLQQGEKEAIQNDFKRYGITGQDYQVVITDAQLKWQAMSYPTKDLMLFEEIEDDIDRIVDAYDWERDLLSRQKGSTFTNKKEAKKYVYESAIIPESKSRLQKFSEQFLPQGQYLISDYSDLYIFQEDKAKQAQALYTLNKAMETAFNAGVITVDEWRLKLENYE
jgi:phage portal protein BeeE